MKNYIINLTIFFLLLIPIRSISQFQPAQSFCDQSIRMCKIGTNGVVFGPQYNNVCIGGMTKLYYDFTPVQSFVSNNTPSANLALGHDIQNNNVPISSIYKIYGPFEGSENACDLISTYQAPILDQSTVFVSYGIVYTGSFIAGKKYILEITANSCEGVVGLLANNGHENYLNCDINNIPCENCLPKFQPSNGQYVVSAWVKQENPSAGTTTYTIPKIKVVAGPAPDNLNGPVVTQTLAPSGRIIDGWQKIEEIIFVTDETSFEIKLEADGAANVLFDDIRVYPNDGSAISYVYDPITLRLMAELDERNFATLYEYDEEGKLIRVKKETEKGIMTIQENRDNNSLK